MTEPWRVDRWEISGVHTGWRVIRGAGWDMEGAPNGAFAFDMYKPGDAEAKEAAAHRYCDTLNRGEELLAPKATAPSETLEGALLRARAFLETIMAAAPSDPPLEGDYEAGDGEAGFNNGCESAAYDAALQAKDALREIDEALRLVGK